MLKKITPLKKIPPLKDLRLTVAIFSSDQGHLSIAKGIQEALEPEYKTVLFFERDTLLDLYMPTYRFFPALNNTLIRMAIVITPIIDTVFALAKSKYLTKFAQVVKKNKADLCICTYAIFNPALESVVAKNKIPFLNVITDPITFYSHTISEPAQSNLVFNENTAAGVIRYLPNAHTDITGWFVRKEFSEPYLKSEVRKEFQLPTKSFVITVASGSDGTNHILKLLPTILNTARPVTIFVLTGSNKQLLDTIKALNLALRHTHPHLTITPVGFTTEIHKYFQVADLVVGKAGPNSIFECVATLTPFFAITHVSGQEDGNLEMIRFYKLGYVEEDAFKASKILQRIIEHPEELKAFQPHLKKMAEYNQGAGERLREVVRRLIKK